MSKKVMRRILELQTDRIIYICCNLGVLKDNLEQICQKGFRVAMVQPLDMFPQTPHIETVILFER